MGFDESTFKRRQPINCTHLEIKRLMLQCLNRALYDLKSKKLALSPTLETQGRKDLLRNQSIVFLRSVWCQDMCDFVGIDYNLFIVKAQKIIVEASENKETMSRSSEAE